jgi:glycosyltransferase involved in cell wall biosynthesis
LPTSPGRFFATPFFVPGARAAEKNALEKHHRQEKIQILFCGDQARRKGLDLVIEAFFKLPVTVRRRASLRVISRLSDGALSIPDDPSIKVESGLPHHAVMEAMRDAHILAVPSRFESYGLVFLEAMSRGTLVIAPNWEVQRELLDYGRAGILVDPGACKSLVDALELSIEDEEARVRLSTKGYERFNQCYSPERVAKRFLSMVQTANSGASDIPTN